MKTNDYRQTSDIPENMEIKIAFNPEHQDEMAICLKPVSFYCISDETNVIEITDSHGKSTGLRENTVYYITSNTFH